LARAVQRDPNYTIELASQPRERPRWRWLGETFRRRYFFATSVRYHRKMVSGVTMLAMPSKPTPTENFAFHGQAAALVIGDGQAAAAGRR